jgi:trans-aconitate 2-methyltransferase
VAGQGRGRPIDWNASRYEQLSTPQQAWGNEVLDRLVLRGDEVVLDLGCGAGQVTERLVALVPAGRVVGVDASVAMLDAARARLGSQVELVLADLRTFTYPQQADVVFSTAALHWVPDHPALWRRVHAMLRPGGRLEVQCGGAGNIAAVVAALQDIAGQQPFASFLAPYHPPWTFDAPDTAARELRAQGFDAVRTWVENRVARPPHPRAYLANVIVPHELDRLPPPLRARFADAVYTRLARPDQYDYVRLNISAIRCASRLRPLRPGQPQLPPPAGSAPAC